MKEIKIDVGVRKSLAPSCLDKRILYNGNVIIVASWHPSDTRIWRWLLDAWEICGPLWYGVWR